MLITANMATKVSRPTQLSFSEILVSRQTGMRRVEAAGRQHAIDHGRDLALLDHRQNVHADGGGDQGLLLQGPGVKQAAVDAEAVVQHAAQVDAGLFPGIRVDEE